MSSNDCFGTVGQRCLLDIGVHTDPTRHSRRLAAGSPHQRRLAAPAGGLDRRGQAAIIRPLGSADSPPGARLWFWGRSLVNELGASIPASHDESKRWTGPSRFRLAQECGARLRGAETIVRPRPAPGGDRSRAVAAGVSFVLDLCRECIHSLSAILHGHSVPPTGTRAASRGSRPSPRPAPSSSRGCSRSFGSTITSESTCRATRRRDPARDNLHHESWERCRSRV